MRPRSRGSRSATAAGSYFGDRRLFASVSPGVTGRDTASVAFSLDRPATVRLDAVHAALRKRTTVWQTERVLRRGLPPALVARRGETPVGSYVMRLTVEDQSGNRRRTAAAGRRRPRARRTPVVRVLGVAAAFEQAQLRAARAGTADGHGPTRSGSRSSSWPAAPRPSTPTAPTRCAASGSAPPRSFAWSRKRSSPQTIVGQPRRLVSGVYAARADHRRRPGRLRARLLRPPTLGTVRQAVVMPTNTWQAYNFDDSDGDGWGDTWYAGGNPPVRLNRPYRQRGTPPWFRRSRRPVPQVPPPDRADARRAGRRRPRGLPERRRAAARSTTSSSSRATRST